MCIWFNRGISGVKGLAERGSEESSALYIVIIIKELSSSTDVCVVFNHSIDFLPVANHFIVFYLQILLCKLVFIRKGGGKFINITNR